MEPGNVKHSILLLAALALTAMPGCGPRDTRYHAPTIRVKGKLLVDGKPYGPCVIYFCATKQDADTTKWIPTVTGHVKDDGSFELTTYAEGDGAPVGTYAVSLGSEAANLLAKLPECKPLDVEIQNQKPDVKSVDVEVKLVSGG